MTADACGAVPALLEPFESVLAVAPDDPLIHTLDGRAVSAREIDAAATELQRALAEIRQAEAPERIGIQLGNCPAFLAALVAVWRSGSSAVLLSPQYGEQESAAAMEKAGVGAVISRSQDDDSMIDRALGAATVRVVGTGRAGGHPGPGEDEALVLFTGGTTGVPKAVTISHGRQRGALAKLVWKPVTASALHRRPSFVLLPVYHAGGLQLLLLGLLLRRPVLLFDRFSVDRLRRALERFRPRHLMLMPTMIHDLSISGEDIDLSSVVYVVSGGQLLDPVVRRRFQDRFGIPILSNYGSTETGNVAGWSLADVQRGVDVSRGVGRIYPGIELEIRSEGGSPSAPGEVGSIIVRTGVASGYVDEAGDGLIEGGWIDTGDLGRVVDDVLFVEGRKRELIKCGGFQVWPAEIEEVLREHPSVSDVAVLGVADDRLGEVPVAFVVARGQDATTSDWKDEIVAYCRSRVAHFKSIRRVVPVESIPRSPLGKTVKHLLLESATRP